MKVNFSPAAQADLLDIALYIAQDSPTRALSFVDELEAKCLRLGQVSGIGTARPELGDGLRVLPHGNYLIFYRDHESGLRIERVMHGARDIGGDDFDADR
ncbi:MAG TPA: type II toxin-antitoxin system RelE/ParE family toxin [Rubrivivax sp.]|jgi:toxin ParE1/3/4|nr:type II toxin-antitoxin system RelE/ParE family toxin [Rubrivivax sp.]